MAINFRRYTNINWGFVIVIVTIETLEASQESVTWSRNYKHDYENQLNGDYTTRS